MNQAKPGMHLCPYDDLRQETKLESSWQNGVRQTGGQAKPAIDDILILHAFILPV